MHRSRVLMNGVWKWVLGQRPSPLAEEQEMQYQEINPPGLNGRECKGRQHSRTQVLRPGMAGLWPS